MSLYCADGLLATFPPPGPPPPKPERGAPWRPPDASSSTCQRCGRQGWQHRSHPPVLADEIDRAIYAAAFVAYARVDGPINDRLAIELSESLVERHRRARSGT